MDAQLRAGQVPHPHPSYEIVLAPVKAKLVSSVAVILTGTVFTGASFTAVTVMPTLSVSLKGVPAASVLTTVPGYRPH